MAHDVNNKMNNIISSPKSQKIIEEEIQAKQ